MGISSIESTIKSACIPVQAMTILRWLDQHKRPVVNGLMAAQLENSKALQYMTALKYGMTAPRTLLTAKPSAQVSKWQQVS